MVRSQVRRGRPGRRLQSLGNPRIDVYRALDVSCESPIRATLHRQRTMHSKTHLLGLAAGLRAERALKKVGQKGGDEKE